MNKSVLRSGAVMFTTVLMLFTCGYRVVTLWPKPRDIEKTVTNVRVVPTQVPLDVTKLAQLTLFSVHEKDPTQRYRVGSISPDSPDLRHAPVSSLSARLTGAISGKRGMAIVEQNGRQYSYSIGEKLLDGSFLIRIFQDRIIISRQGQYEALLLE